MRPAARSHTPSTQRAESWSGRWSFSSTSSANSLSRPLTMAQPRSPNRIGVVARLLDRKRVELSEPFEVRRAQREAHADRQLVGEVGIVGRLVVGRPLRRPGRAPEFVRERGLAAARLVLLQLLVVDPRRAEAADAAARHPPPPRLVGRRQTGLAQRSAPPRSSPSAAPELPPATPPARPRTVAPRSRAAGSSRPRSAVPCHSRRIARIRPGIWSRSPVDQRRPDRPHLAIAVLGIDGGIVRPRVARPAIEGERDECAETVRRQHLVARAAPPP